MLTIDKAIQLMEYTMTVTSNRKRYPIKYIQLINRIQNKSMDIYEALTKANSLDVNKYLKERIMLETEAISNCNQLSCYVELSMNLNRIGSDTVSCWQKKISDVKYMTISWRTKEEDR